jgi:hypothetical protein
MKRESNRRTPLVLYVLAAPIYCVRAALRLVRLFRLWRISRLGYVDCPHCGTENAIDILADCPRCRTSEYGNRLRCTACGTSSTAFPCDSCGVTIHCL